MNNMVQMQSPTYGRVVFMNNPQLGATQVAPSATLKSLGHPVATELHSLEIHPKLFTVYSVDLGTFISLPVMPGNDFVRPQENFMQDSMMDQLKDVLKTRAINSAKYHLKRDREWTSKTGWPRAHWGSNSDYPLSEQQLVARYVASYYSDVADIIFGDELFKGWSMYNDIKQIFEVETRRDNPTKWIGQRRVIIESAKSRLFMLNDFETYYYALADEYGFGKKFSNIIISRETCEIGLPQRKITRENRIQWWDFTGHMHER